MHERVLRILSYCKKHGVITQEYENERIAALREKYPLHDETLLYKRFLRSLGVSNFLVYSAILNFDIFASPSVYPRIVQTRMYSTKPIFFLMMPRGTWKSVWGLAAWAEWVYLRSRTTGNKQAVNTCFIHGNIDKASSNLDVVRDHVKSDIIQYLYGDIFKIKTDNATQLDFEDNTSPIKLKDCAFEVGSVESDLAGKHFARLALDDFSTDKNCDTVEKNEKNRKAFYRLFSLADRVDGRIMQIDYVGTAYYTNSITEELHKHPKWDRWCERMIFQASYDIVESNGETRTIYPFHQLPQEQIEMYRDTLPAEEFMSQYYMRYYERDSRLPYYELPEYYDPFNENDARYSPIEWCGLLIDPAVKKRTSTARKSLMTVLVVVVTMRREIFVVDGCFLRGVTPSEFRERIEGFVRNYPIEEAVIENIAAQEYMRQDLRESSELGQMGRYFTIIEHAHYENKREHYKAFLEPLLRRGIIRVNPQLEELINELKGVSQFEDAIDCLSFIKEKRFSFVPQEDGEFISKNTHKWGEPRMLKKMLKRRSPFAIITPYI